MAFGTHWHALGLAGIGVSLLALLLGACSESSDDAAVPGSGGGQAGGGQAGSANPSGGNANPSGGSAGSGTMLPPSTPVAVEQLPDAFLTAVCEALLGCNPEGYRDVLDCKADHLVAGADDVIAGVADGHIAYDADTIGACLAVIRTRMCRSTELVNLSASSLPGFVDACLGNQGLQTAGADCRSNVECADGLTCFGPTCPGTCEPLGTDGADCSVIGCLPIPEIGLIARLSDDDAADIEEDRLQDSMVRCIDGTCRGPAAIGNPCVGIQACENGFCNGTICEADRLEGAECTSEPNIEMCDEVLRCQGACFRPLPAGEMCLNGALCADGLSCVPTPDIEMLDLPGAGRCAIPGGIGAMCHEAADCAKPLGCTYDGVCAGLPGLGEDCLDDGRCGPGLICGDGCTPPAFVGDPCTSSCIGECRDGMCQPRRELGEECVTSEDCKSRHCYADVCVDTAACAARGT